MAANHGSSPAAWTTVTIIVVGFTVGAFALVFDNIAVVVASGGIVVVGLIVGKVMQLMGLGQRSSAASPRSVGWEEDGAGRTEPEGAR